jgi:sugar phosphate isomerase/epimerase
LVEPEPDLMIETSGQFREFIKDVQSKSIGLNFDIGHFFCVGEDPREAFEALFQWVGHVHLEDIAPSREHNHLIAGRGAIEFKKVFTSMVQLGYTGDISLELYTYQDTPEEAGQESLNYLQPIFEEAGLLIE